MPDLETLLRDVRPAPEPAWAAQLDARVAAGFPGPPPRWKAPFVTLRANLLALGTAGSLAALVGVLIVAAIHSGGATSTEGDGSKAAAARPGGGEDSAAGAGASLSAPTAIAPVGQAPRSVRSSASLTLACPPAQVATVTDRAIRVVDGLDGFVQSSQINSSGAEAGATLTLKVPSSRLESALAQLSRLAHVKARSQESEDLTDQRAALTAAVRDARADRAGLRARLAKAETEHERSRLRAQLDRATRRVTRRERTVAALDREVSYATVDLAIEGDRSAGAAPGDHWTPGDAFRDAGRVLEVIAGVLVIAFAVLLPVGVIAVLIALGARIFVRRARERALEIA